MTSLSEIAADLHAWTWCTWHRMRSSLTSALAPAAGWGRAQKVCDLRGRRTSGPSFTTDFPPICQLSVVSFDVVKWIHITLSLKQFTMLVKKTQRSKRWPLRTTHMIVIHYKNNKSHHAELIAFRTVLNKPVNVQKGQPSTKVHSHQATSKRKGESKAAVPQVTGHWRDNSMCSLLLLAVNPSRWLLRTQQKHLHSQPPPPITCEAARVLIPCPTKFHVVFIPSSF